MTCMAWLLVLGILYGSYTKHSYNLYIIESYTQEKSLSRVYSDQISRQSASKKKITELCKMIFLSSKNTKLLQRKKNLASRQYNAHTWDLQTLLITIFSRTYNTDLIMTAYPKLTKWILVTHSLSDVYYVSTWQICTPYLSDII